MTIRNPKQVETNIFDCIPQSGKCPIGCNQCFFNRPGAFYTAVPSVPTREEVGDGVVRMNTGHDSNCQRELVIETAKQFDKVFFNTSVPRLDFPGPVVLTANPKEEQPARHPMETPPNLMFVRLRVSSTNLDYVDEAVVAWTSRGVPVVLTFMSYYDAEPKAPQYILDAVGGPCYEWRVRHINSYWCPTKPFLRFVMGRYADHRLVSMCGSIDVGYCKACRNCETHYLQTMKRMAGE